LYRLDSLGPVTHSPTQMKPEQDESVRFEGFMRGLSTINSNLGSSVLRWGDKDASSLVGVLTQVICEEPELRKLYLMETPP